MSKVLLKEKAVNLRMEGYSVKEISDKLNVSKSTSSVWVRDLILNEKAKQRLIDRQLIGYYKAAQHWKNKNVEEEKEYNLIANDILRKINLDIYQCKLLCALLYWCEGSKNSTGLGFTNSDPELIKTFITLFRKAFTVDETKFRALVHLHGYHNENEQKKFWSSITNIPESRFQKSYRKANSGKRIKKDYPGCISIRYYDSKVFKQLKALYRSFFKNMGV